MLARQRRSTRPSEQQIRNALREHRCHVLRIVDVTRDNAVLVVDRKHECWTSFFRFDSDGDRWEFSVPYEGFIAEVPCRAML